MSKQTQLDEKAGVLFDYAVDHRDGFTYEQVATVLGWDYATFMDVVRRLRLILGDEEHTLLCTPQGSGERWLYRLTDDPDVHLIWSRFRLRTVETSLETAEHAAQSITNATDGRTVDGRKARIILRSVHRLREDLAEIAEAGSVAVNS